MARVAAEHAEALEVLEGTRWLAKCGAATFELLLRSATVLRYGKGESVTIPGQSIDHLWIVLKGVAEMYSTSAAGHRFVLAYLPPGEPFGIASMIDGRGAVHGVRAHQPSTLLRVPRIDVLSAMQSDATLLESVLRMFARRSRMLSSSLADATMLPLATRLARHLLFLGASYGVEDGTRGRAISLRLGQDDLAAMLGVSRQRLNMQLKDMERRGVLKLAYARVVLLDEDALAVMANDAGD